MSHPMDPCIPTLFALRRLGYDTLSPSDLRLLGAILAIADEGRPITVRGLVRRLGLSSPNAISRPLQRLRQRGLITYIGKKDGRVFSATIRPACTFLRAPP